MKHIKQCPKCNSVMEYKTKDGVTSSIKQGRLCRSCACYGRVYSMVGKQRQIEGIRNSKLGKTYEEIHGKEMGNKKRENHSKIMTGKKRTPFTTEHRKNISISHKESIVYNNAMQSKEYRHIRAEIAIKTQTGLSYDEWLKSKTERELYYREVKRITKSQPLHTLKNIEKRGHYNNNGWQLDHIYPISAGFINNISPHIIGHIHNLQMLPAVENSRKGSRIS